MVPEKTERALVIMQICFQANDTGVHKEQWCCSDGENGKIAKLDCLR